jgi:putative glycosyltransferase
LIDSDLEESPELLYDFWIELTSAQGIDVIYGVQEKRKGKIFERISGFLFYKIFNLFSEYAMTPNLSVVRLMRINYVKNLILHA